MTKPGITNIKPYAHAALYMGFIYLISSMPHTKDRVFISWVGQNILHIPLYGMLAFLWMRAFRYNGLPFNRAVVTTLIITILYAFSDEYHQSFVPGRDASLADIAFDCLGAFAGTLIYRYKR